MKRFFNKTEKQILWLAANGKCQNCGLDLPKNFHADHIKPYSKGGITKLNNAQALCPKCNILKSNKYTMLKNEIQLRGWQSTAMSIFEKKRAKGQSRFLFSAGVGSGKTLFAAYLAVQLKKAGKIDKVIIISPRASINYDWAIQFQDIDNTLKTWHTYNDPSNFRVSDVICVTYQKLGSSVNSLIFSKFCNERVLIIIDEVHHAAKDKNWGDALKNAFSEAGIIISLTGTPYRSDNYPIPFCEYEKCKDTNLYKLKSDFQYGYGKAVADKVVCPTTFHLHDSKSNFLKSGDLVLSEQDEEEQEKFYRKMIRVKTGRRENWVYHTFQHADNNLQQINERVKGNFAGLIVCNTIPDARNIYSMICGDYGSGYAELITSDNETESGVISDTTQIIRKLKNSNVRWIVSVKMISEGVNIPRIRCIVYASSVTTRLYFEQVMGRGVRKPKNFKDFEDRCHVYIAEYYKLIDHSKRIEEEMVHEIEEKKEKEGGLDGSNKTPVEDIDPLLSGDSYLTGTVISGDYLTYQEYQKLSEIARMQGLTPEKIKSIMDMVASYGDVPNYIDTSVTYQDRCKAVSDDCNSKVGAIVNATGKEFYEVHNELNYQVTRKHNTDGKVVPAKSFEELKKKLSLAIEYLNDLNSRKL
jgi:superfamily II DNA or RNA helicase